MSIRLNKVTKEFNIGLQTAVEFLQKKGFTDVEANPNYKITEEQYAQLQSEFSLDKGLRNEATQLIQQHIGQNKKERKEENLERGREMLEHETKRLGYTQKNFMSDDHLLEAASKFNINDPTDMLAALGYGGITINAVMSKLIEIHRREIKQSAPPDLEHMLEGLKQPQKGKHSKSSHGVLVEGESGLMVHLARCCNPIPGDPIVGYITRGRGVSVHRADCPNLLHDSSELDRLIEVSWDVGLDKVYTVSIAIVCNDKTGVLSTLLAVPAEMKVNINSINAKPNRRNKTSTIIMGLDVKSADQVEQIITKLRRQKDVFSVTRAVGSGKEK